MLTVIQYLSYFLAVSSFTGDAPPPRDIHCIAQTVYHEARGEPILGQVAVASVVMNRVNHERWGKDVCSVVFAPHQFTDIQKTRFVPEDKKAWKQAVEIATLTYTGFIDDPTFGATNYYNPDKVGYDPWTELREIGDIGNHRFKKGD
ncbi:cell wall hydrolase [Candidatus Pacearchaeota archaeon]|nr:cell wall hydrolase [Candidatus Pacearchaeota archaeon]